MYKKKRSGEIGESWGNTRIHPSRLGMWCCLSLAWRLEGYLVPLLKLYIYTCWQRVFATIIPESWSQTGRVLRVTQIKWWSQEPRHQKNLAINARGKKNNNRKRIPSSPGIETDQVSPLSARLQEQFDSPATCGSYINSALNQRTFKEWTCPASVALADVYCFFLFILFFILFFFITLLAEPVIALQSTYISFWSWTKRALPEESASKGPPPYMKYLPG